jgi:hypothetical protein
MHEHKNQIADDSFKQDIWSVGMIAGFCLSGNLFHSHRFGQVNFKGEEWNQVSKSSKNFIR